MKPLNGLKLTVTIVVLLSTLITFAACDPFGPRANYETLSKQLLQIPSSAPDSVKTEIRNLLISFQQGYISRDTSRVEVFMQQHFSNESTVLALGTEPGEWMIGYENVSSLLYNDWAHWGDLRLDVDNAAIAALGSTAWLQTIGQVGNEAMRLPLRFTGILAYETDGWKFRQVQYQWEVSIRH